MRTLKIENSADFGMEYGLEMDIFPLDAWSGGKMQAIRCGVWRRGLSAAVKDRFESRKSGVQRGILFGIWKISRFLGFQFFLNRIDLEICLGRKKTFPKYMGSVAWSLYGSKELIPAKVFGKTVMVEFEGDFYTAPDGYDQYLRQLYGRYEDDPPVEMQRTHHQFQVSWR